MGRLVALALPAGPDYPAAIRRVWDAGDAIAPLDDRLPKAELDRILSVLQPEAVIEADGEIRALPGGRPVEDGDALVIATSGTSGRPKGVIHTHRSIEAAARATGAALSVDPTADRWLACLPVAHIGGLAVIMRSLVTDTPVEVHPRFDARAVAEAARNGCTLTSMVTRALNQVPTELFRTILIGGAAPPPERPANVIATYGMTETGSGVVYESTMLDGLEISIDHPGAADPAEIHLRGPMLFRAYRRTDGIATATGTNTDTDSGAEDPFDAEGWFATGDLGSWAADGRLIVAGRRGDVIVTGGEKVWPDPIERLLLERDDISQVALVGRPDPDWGYIVTAVVVVANGHRRPDLADIRATVTEHQPVWAAPKALEFADDLPRTSLGKVRRNLL